MRTKKLLISFALASLLVSPLTTSATEAQNEQTDLQTTTTTEKKLTKEQLQEKINDIHQNSKFRFAANPKLPTAVKGSKYTYELKPGDTITDYILVKNFSTETVTFQTYGADGMLTQDGKDSVKSRTAEQTEIGSWLKVENPKFTLRPDETKELEFTMTIPEDAEFKEYKGGIVTERLASASPDAPIKVNIRNASSLQVLVTDEPLPVPLEGNIYQPTFWDSPYINYYFWISLVLFLSSIILLAYSERQDKKKKKKQQKQKTK